MHQSGTTEAARQIVPVVHPHRRGPPGVFGGGGTKAVYEGELHRGMLQGRLNQVQRRESLHDIHSFYANVSHT